MKMPLLKLLPLLGLLCVTAAPSLRAQSVGLERVVYYSQTSASTVTPHVTPYTFIVALRGGSMDMSAWGPAFYKPGSGGVPATGASSDTNTGTVNFTATPNSYTDYIFMHDFASNAAMEAAYPVAPTDGGAYGIKFLGAGAPTPATFTAGMAFAGGTYPSVTPQISSVDNGAVWSNGLLINSHGVTTLTFNALPEYTTSTYGAFTGVGIYDNAGHTIAPASVNSFYVPSAGVTQPAITQVTLDGAWLTPGVTYTLELQYGVLSTDPGQATLSGTDYSGHAASFSFQTISAYYKYTTINIRTIPSLAAFQDADGAGRSDPLWRNANTGEIRARLANGASIGYGTEGGGWTIIGSGDYNGDGKSEPLWHNATTGEIRAWFLTGGSTGFGSEGGGWSVVGSGDYNGDGKSEPLWRNSNTGEIRAWFITGGSIGFGNEGGGWSVIATGDFNGDGRSEPLWHNTSTGEVRAWYSTGGSVGYGTESGGWIVVGVDDFDGDHKDEPLWLNTGTGEARAWLNVGGSIGYGNEGGGWSVIATGDFNSDGKSEPLWRNSSTREVRAWFQSGGSLGLGTEDADWSVATD